MEQVEAPRRGDLIVTHLRILRLLEWDTPTDEILERLDMAPHEISNVARCLRHKGFPLHKRTRHGTCAKRRAQKTRRPCLRCRSTFLSDGFHHRICTDCKDADVWHDHASRVVA